MLRLVGPLIGCVVRNHAIRVEGCDEIGQTWIVERSRGAFEVRGDGCSRKETILGQHADGAAVEIVAQEQLELSRQTHIGFVIVPLSSEKN